MTTPDADVPESLSNTELLERSQEYAATVDIGADLDAIEWEVTERAKRRAGACAYDPDTEQVTIRLSRDAFEEHGWTEFCTTIRHELIHAWEYQQFGESSHGSRFKLKANELDVDVHCESFTDPRLRLTCTSDGCDWELKRYRASKTVTQPERYSCGECGSDYNVRHCATGERWRTKAGYERARERIGDEW